MRRCFTIAACGAAVVMTACSGEGTPEDFKDKGEEFINDDERIEETLGTDFSDAECEEPADDEIGTTYACTAAGADGSTWRFTVEITGENELTVQGGEPTN